MKFNDKEGREWDLNLDLGACRRIDDYDWSQYSDKPISVLNMDGDTIQALFANSAVALAMVFRVVLPRALNVYANREVTADIAALTPGAQEGELLSSITDQETKISVCEQLFYADLDSDAFENAKQGLWGALADFFPRHRNELHTLIEGQRQIEETIQKELSGISSELREKILEPFAGEIRKRRENLLNSVGGTFTQE